MNVVVSAAGIALIALALAACGRGNGEDDEAAIEDLVDGLVSAFGERDADKIAGLFSRECENREADSARFVEFAEREDLRIEVRQVHLRNLADDSAEFRAEGTRTFSTGEAPLDESVDYHKVVREGGGWKIADCDLFFGELPGEAPVVR